MKILNSQAKINIFLEITGKCQKTNYHFINSLFLPISLNDKIIVSQSKKFEVIQNNKIIEKNILYKVESFIKKHIPQTNINFSFEIQKKIPIKSGLGGASSNAASVLLFLLDKSFNFKQFYDSIALEIGADVPFFLENKPLICTSFGQNLANPNFQIPTNIKIKIAKPQIGISTPELFSMLTKEDFCQPSSPKSFQEALKIGNVFTKYAIKLCPQIEYTLKTMEDLHGTKSYMSGTGSSCFCIIE